MVLLSPYLLTQEFDRARDAERLQGLAQSPDFVRLIGGVQESFLSCPGTCDIQRWENPLVCQFTVKRQLHIAGAFGLLEDHLVHTTAGVDQGGGDCRHGCCGCAPWRKIVVAS